MAFSAAADNSVLVPNNCAGGLRDLHAQSGKAQEHALYQGVGRVGDRWTHTQASPGVFTP